MRLFTCVFFILILAVPVFPFSDQLTTERMLSENKDFIEFMNTCMSNFGQNRLDKYRERFLEIYQYHFNAQVFFLQSDYKNAYLNIRQSQKIQMQLYSDMLRKVYLEDAKGILDKLAPEIIKSKNTRARLYLTLGYRDRAVGKNFQKIGSASNPKLYSYIIYKYEKAIKLTRRAKRYGLLSLYESRDNDIKRKIFNQLLEKEIKAGSKFYRRFLGKDEKAYLDEMGKTFVEHEKEEQSREKAGTNKTPGTEDDKTFEKKVEKRVRFRVERRLANNLINSEFEKAEDVIRKYVDDFNFKLILATIEVLSVEKTEEGPDKVDFKSYFDHHYDNYSRLPKDKKSLLEVLGTEVKVIDDIDKDEETDNIKDGDKKSGENKKEDPSKKKN